MTTSNYWGENEESAVEALLALAWQEDLNACGDITTQTLLEPLQRGSAFFIAKQEGVVSGLPIISKVFSANQNSMEIEFYVEDGTFVEARQQLARIDGSLRSILEGERIALNFLQHLSGISTLTKRYVDAIAGTGCRLLDTRKTLPGWRVLEKYAVRCGGGHNHRMGLFDAILIKDNHVAALRHEGYDIAAAVKKAQSNAKSGVTLEVEVDQLSQLEQVLPLKPDRVLLDNMNPELLRTAVAMRNRLASAVKLEASGGITLATIRAVALTGVDFISCGALTHSAPALDIALDYQN